IDAAALEKVEDHVADAVAKGARVARGGRRHALGGTFYEPTVLLDAAPGMRLAEEETFGPVAALFRFSAEDEAVALANATEVGLAGYFYTRDLARAWRVAEALECGIVGINTGLVSTEVAPFGGIKQSGIGREGSKYGLDDYTELKYVCLGGMGCRTGAPPAGSRHWRCWPQPRRDSIRPGAAQCQLHAQWHVDAELQCRWRGFARQRLSRRALEGCPAAPPAGHEQRPARLAGLYGGRGITTHR